MEFSNICKIREWYMYHRSTRTSVNFWLLMFVDMSFYFHIPLQLDYFAGNIKRANILVHVCKW